jgi:hypothetical protein
LREQEVKLATNEAVKSVLTIIFFIRNNSLIKM